MASSSTSDIYQANDLRDFIANLPEEILDEVVKDIPLPGEVTETASNLNSTLLPAAAEAATAPAADAANAAPSTPVSRAFVCTTCNRALKRRKHLRNHQYSHRPYDERPYGCTKCGKKYISKWALTRHCKVKHSPPAALQHHPGPHGFEESEPSNQ
ncbi:C2H2-type transcription factor Trm2 [Aphelenchoides avenae]|nr:C2H2-type transcription factor Trm2 [Aphelenchus avenae]